MVTPPGSTVTICFWLWLVLFLAWRSISAQGLFTGVLLGLSAAVGAFVGGFLYENVGPVTMFRLIGFFVLPGVTFFLLVGKRIMQLEVSAS